jgi:hypothetical protein
MIIFSLTRPEFTREQQNSYIELMKFMIGKENVESCTGSWMGVEEQSYIVPNRFESDVQSLCQATNQDAYIISGHYDYYYLVNARGEHLESFKYFKEVDATTAHKLDGYTKRYIKDENGKLVSKYYTLSNI